MLQQHSSIKKTRKKDSISHMLFNVESLIWSLALPAYKKLPPMAKKYLEVEDLVADGRLCLLSELRQQKFDATRASFVTFAYIRLSSLFADRLRREWNEATKVLPIDMRMDSMNMTSDMSMEDIYEIFNEKVLDIMEGLSIDSRKIFCCLLLPPEIIKKSLGLPVHGKLNYSDIAGFLSYSNSKVSICLQEIRQMINEEL